jgi:hypothetical protein
VDIDITVAPSTAYPPAVMRRLVGTKTLRQNCAIAQGIKNALGELLHPKCPPEVGLDRDGRKFIMIKLADGHTLKWYDSSVPARAWRAVKANDEGRAFRAFTFTLKAADAIITPPKVIPSGPGGVRTPEQKAHAAAYSRRKRAERKAAADTTPRMYARPFQPAA